MKIVDHALYRYRLPLTQPLRFGAQCVVERVGFLLQLIDAQGREGWGEAAPLPGFGCEPLTEVPEHLLRAARALPAELASTPEMLSQQIPDAPPATHAALETALADLAAQQAGLPLCHWLDPAAAAQITVNGLLGEASEQALKKLRKGLDAGLRCFKIKVGIFHWSDEWALLQRLRRAAPNVQLRLDCNGEWTEAQLRERAPQLQQLAVQYLEQPLPVGQIAELIALSGKLGLPLAVDEALIPSANHAPLLACKGSLTFVIKPAVQGGPLSAWDLIQRATASGIRCVVTHLIDGPVGRGMALQVALAADGSVALPLAHGLGLPPFAEGHDDGPRPVDGRLTCPPGVGLGVQPVPGRLERLG